MNTVLDSLFPPGAASVLSLAGAQVRELTPAELRFTATFAPRRLEEFRHGRTCARQALARLGAGEHDIPIGASREPVWPTGVVGSISHAGSAAAAVVAWASSIASLGLDLEPATALEPALVPRICRPDEIDCIASSRYGAGTAAKMVFSMKEASYKALWPVLRCFLDFHDIELVLDEPLAMFQVTSRTGRLPAEMAARIEGRFVHVEGLFAAGATLR